MRSIADGWAAGRAAAMGLRACASASRKAPGTCARVPSTHFSWAKSAHQSIRACAGGCRRYITVSMHRTLLGLFLALSLSAADVNTFSIVAYDPATGDCGVTVASKYFSVGAVVPWAEAGTGCIATQANVNVGYGPRGLELLRQGLAARQVIDKLLATTPSPARMAARWPSSTIRVTSPLSPAPTRPTGRATARARPGPRRATSS